jgi:drug/metabolite transporter (DMT)-like permease
MHTTTGQWNFGISLALITTFMWGLLPIALKALLDGMDPYTITWYRLFSASIVLGLFLQSRHSIDIFQRPSRNNAILLFLTILGLLGNYIIYLLGLDFISPNSAQIVIQLAPVFLLVGGILFFGEQFQKRQWIGYGILIFGLLLFFNERLEELFIDVGDYATGVALILVAGISWSMYALTSKQLLGTYSSSNIMLVIYLSGAIFLLPLADIPSVMDMTGPQYALLAFVSLNSLIAYGCFAEALNHIEASRVSTILAITPLLTVIFIEIGVRVIPDYTNEEPLNWISMIGALLVVAGSMTSSLARKSPRTETEKESICVEGNLPE